MATNFFTSPSFRPGDVIGGSPFSNFRTTMGANFSTPDLQALWANTERSRRAHDALTQARLAEANRDNQLFQSASDADIQSLFSQPTNPTQQRLQKIVNRDIISKELGAQMIPNWKMTQAYESGLLGNLQKAESVNNARFGRQMDAAQFDLNSAKFEQDQMNALNALFNQRAQREHARQQLEAQERYRQAQIANAEANRQLRGQQFGQTQQQRNLQTMMEMERMAQQNVNEQARQQAALYGNVSIAAAEGALPQSDIRALFQNRLDPASLRMAEGYAQQYGRGEQQLNEFARAQAALANQRLQQGGSQGQFLVPTIQEELNSDRNLAGRVFYDPNIGAFRASGAPDEDTYYPGGGIDSEMFDMLDSFEMAPPPPPQNYAAPQGQQAQRMPVTEGRVRRHPSTGELIQFRNGQWVPIQRRQSPL